MHGRRDGEHNIIRKFHVPFFCDLLLKSHWLNKGSSMKTSLKYS